MNLEDVPPLANGCMETKQQCPACLLATKFAEENSLST